MQKTFVWLVLAALVACQTGKQASGKTPDALPQKSPVGCAPTPGDLNTPPGKDGKLAPLFKGLDVYHYEVTTTSKLAQKYFDQGYVLAMGFNHAEAARSFRQCVIEDPQCAMGFWGQAYVLGPNYNAPMEMDVLPMALEALQQARLVMHTATPKERALIEALEKRYPPNSEVDPVPFYTAYAEAMKNVMKAYPDDPDVAALTAESLMNLHPWDLYEKTTGDPKEWTPEILAILTGILNQHPKHPQAAHLFIHATEAGNNPEQALPYARMLLDRVPGSGHLVHMPSHTYINTGHFHEGTVSNQLASRVDSQYVASCHEAGVYELAYYPHNLHFLAACAAMEGRGKISLEASRYMADVVVNKELWTVPALASLQHFYSIPWFIQVKFGMWDDILRESAPDKSLVYPTAVWNYAQGMANAAKGDYDKASRNLKVVRDAIQDTSISNLTIWEINKIVDVLKVAEQVLQGQIVLKQGHADIAARFFEQAVKIEDGLNYNEPPDWFFSVRHHQGDALLKAGKFADAENVYRTDLKEWKNNGWALMGLYKALVGQGKSIEAEQTMAKFKEAWKYAEVELSSSVI